MYLPLNNGIRFFQVDGALQSIETDFERERYGAQRIYKTSVEPYAQPIDFDDISRIQAITPINAAVTIQAYGPDNAALFTDTFAYVGNMFDDPTLRVYNYTLNWSNISDLRDCVYIVVSQGGVRFRSEPLRRALDGEVLKFVYSNFYDHRNIGSYRNCFEMVAYIPARLIKPEQPRELASHTDSRMRDVYLSESHFRTRVLDVFLAPHYMHLITQYALRHDKLQIFQKIEGRIYSSFWQWTEQYESDHIDYSSLYRAETTLKKVTDRIRAVTSAGENTFLPVVNILPVTGVTANGFTANWTGVADSFDVQLSASPTFDTTIVSVNTTANSYTFTGLTPCVRYYYRVRAINCAGVGNWTKGVTEEQVSLHFRGEQNFLVWEADELISGLKFFNLFGNLQNVRFKYAPLHGVVSWLSYPYRTLAQVEQDIAFNAVANYSIYFEADGFAQGSEGIGILQYVAPSVRLTVGCLTYAFRQITQDHFIGFRRKTLWQSVATSPSQTLTYAFIPDLNALRQEVFYGITSLTALNAAIATHAGQEYAVAIYVNRTAAQTMPIVTTINLQYL